jgi:hypothetical protein
VTSYRAVDLSELLDTPRKRLLPTVGSRSDEAGLLYRGLIHSVSGESEAGKSWFCSLLARQELEQGNSVVYLDYEDNDEGIVDKLLTIGTSMAHIHQRFRYIGPTEPLAAGATLDDLTTELADHRPTLVVLDGVTEAMVMQGLEMKDNSDVAKYLAALPKRIAAHPCRPAVLQADHMVKDVESRSRYAIGGVHKLNGIDGVNYQLEKVRGIGIGLRSRSRLVLTKDRRGQVRQHGIEHGPSRWHVGNFVLDSRDADHADARIYPPFPDEQGGVKTDGRTEEVAHLDLMTTVAKRLADHGPTSQTKIRNAVCVNSAELRAAVRDLEQQGHVETRGRGSATRLHLLKPYPPGGEPL